MYLRVVWILVHHQAYASITAFLHKLACNLTRTCRKLVLLGSISCLETVTCTAVHGPFFLEIGAGEGIRTLDPNLGKVVLYP